jgi:hypothetical protein
METWENYKLIIFVTFIMTLASIITFSLFLKNIYKNMDEIRRTEIEFRRRISLTEVCCNDKLIKQINQQ